MRYDYVPAPARAARTTRAPAALCVWNGPVRPRRDDPVCRENGYILVKTINLAKDTTTYT